MVYAGFDCDQFPGLTMTGRLKSQSNLVFCGYYLKAPSQSGATWRGQRAALVAQGWGLAPIFVGQQVSGPGSHVVTATQGVIDGRQACADMVVEGFPRGSYVYLDLENGPPLPASLNAYVSAWSSAVEAGGFGTGVYCSFVFAKQVAAKLPHARMWVYHVESTTAHFVSGTIFPTPSPSASGFDRAAVWQRDDEARLTYFGNLACDLDVSIYPDPSAPSGSATFVESPVVAPVEPPAAAPRKRGALPPVGNAVWVQEVLNAAGASPALVVDGVYGPKTYSALIAFQKAHGLMPDGVVGALTVAALQAVVATT